MDGSVFEIADLHNRSGWQLGLRQLFEESFNQFFLLFYRQLLSYHRKFIDVHNWHSFLKYQCQNYYTMRLKLLRR